MARRHPGRGAGSRPRRRRPAVLLATLTAVAATVGLAPRVLVRTPLRDRPLEMALAGIDGSVASGGARWGWFDGVEYRDVVLRDRTGRPALLVPRLAIDRGILLLAVAPRSLGTVRLVDPELVVDVRDDGSSLEDILAPWLAGPRRPVAVELEVVNAAAELTDTVHRVAWRLSDVIAAGTLLPDGSLAGWTAAGRLRTSGTTAPAGRTVPPPDAGGPMRLDRSTLPAAAAAVLARDGGWTVSARPAAAGGGRTITVATHRLPLGFSSVLATRFGLPVVLDGVADLAVDLSVDAAARHVSGDVSVDRLAVCDAVTLRERFALRRCALPLDLSIADGTVSVRRLEATSGAARARATGRFRLPGGAHAGWAEALAGDDFAASIDVDLAAAAEDLPGGVAIRDDTRLTGGVLSLAAACRGDGGDRIVEVRASARDLAAVRQPPAAADGAAAEAGTPREFAWPEPFTAWLRGRLGPARGERLRIEEARLVSAAVEATAAGSASGLAVTWRADLGRVVEELGQLLDTSGAAARGTCSGTLETVADGRGTASGRMSLAVGLADVEVAVPGRPAWRDGEVVVELEAQGSLASGVAAVDACRGVVASGDDRLELAVSGGVVVDLPAVAGFPADASVAAIRPAASGTGTRATCSMLGELARWHPRLAACVPWLATADLGFAGSIEAGVEVEPQGDGWRWSRAGGEIERLVVRLPKGEISEPRVVLTSAGRIDTASGRIDVTGGEMLSTSLSLRTGGMSLLPATAGATPLERVRGRLQWQADVGRVAAWVVPPDVAREWPAAGRGWGSVEVVDTQAGVNMLVEATGSQLAVATGGRGAAAEWTEPRVASRLEVTLPRAGDGREAERLTIDRFELESSTLAVAARGRVDEWTSRRLVSVEGTAAYDWQQVSRLLVPWTGGRIRLAGGESRPFTLRIPLRRPAAATIATAAEPAAATVPLPADWLSATRGAAAGPDDEVRVARPVAAAVARPDGRLAALAIDTTAAWSGGDVGGLPLAAGEMPVRLLEGQLAVGPFDVPLGGGRLRGAPWVRLVPPPGELVIPPGRLAEHVAVSAEVCRRVASWLSPLIGHAAQASGSMSVDLAGARLPLGDPFGGEVVGQVTLENFEVVPSPAMQPLANLLARLHGLVDPRFALGERAVLLRVRPEPVRVRLAGRRLAHDGLLVDSGPLVVKSQGGVGEDGSLEMLVEVALRGDLVGRVPVLGTLFRTPLVVPLRGTVAEPRFDAASLEAILGRITEHAAEAVVRDGIGRGLEAVFGQPAASPSLVIPPR